MGITKSMMMDPFNSNKFVCNKCIRNVDLQKYILKLGERKLCTFCSKRNSHDKSINLGVLASYISEKISIKYSDEIGVTSENEDFMERNSSTTYDILCEHEVAYNNGVLRELSDLIGGEYWVESNGFWGHEIPSWESYCEEIEQGRDCNMDSFNLVKSFIIFIKKYNKFHTLNQEEIFYRARSGYIENSIKNFGAHLNTYNGRANQQGDVALYLSDTKQGAGLELKKYGEIISIGSVQLKKRLNLIDLRHTYIEQGMFCENYTKQEWLYDHFINGFLRDLSKRKGEDYRYKASQYILSNLKQADFKLDEISGVIYKSSMHKTSANIAIWSNSTVNEDQVNDINEYFDLIGSEAYRGPYFQKLL